MRLFRLFPLLLAVALLVLCTISLTQDRSSASRSGGNPASQDKESKTPIIRSTSSLVILDVVVTHNEHPVTGLQQQAFHVFENGREQTIKVFEEHGPGEEARTEKPKLAPDTYSNVPESTDSAINVLLLDAVNTPTEDQAYARRKIIEYLKTVPPGTRIAVFTLASRLRLVQGFTSDSAVLLAAVNKTAPMQSLALPGSTGQSAVDRYASIGIDRSPIGQAGFLAQSAMESMADSLHQFEADEQVSLLERRIQITVDALKQLALYLGALPGRKNLIWFSASFPLSLTPESPLDPFRSLRNYAGQLQQVSDLLTASRVAVYPIDARGLILPPRPARQNRPAAVAIGGGRTGMIDPNAFPSDPSETNDLSHAELATMLHLAEQTGGIAFYNSNDIKHGISKAVENGASYYTLAYSPEDKNFDGNFRRFQVKLAGHGYQLAYRRGYFADAPVARNSNALLGLDFAGLRPDAPPSSQIFFRARVLPAGDPTAQDLPPQPGPAGDLAARLKPPVKRYWIEYTADMHQVSADIDLSGVYRSNIEFIVIAYDRNGNVVNAGRRSFKMGIPPAKYDDVLRTGFSVRNELDLPEGEFWLRLAVHDVSADRIGSIAVPLKTLAAKAN